MNSIEEIIELLEQRNQREQPYYSRLADAVTDVLKLERSEIITMLRRVQNGKAS